MVSFNKEMGRVKGKAGDQELEVVVTVGEVAGVRTQFKRFFVNGVARRRVDFVGNLTSVLFSPSDLEIIAGSPSMRREFLDNVLEQTDRDYRLAFAGFTKAIRQRNALLELAKQAGRRPEREFAYWDSLVIRNGNVITQKREEFVKYLNESKKDILDFKIEYDKSVISIERLLEYRDAETASGVTLVGPHRDELLILLENGEVKSFGSRGQQRLAVLQLKILELLYIEAKLGERPLLLLDDIFSELDSAHIKLVMSIIGLQQTILTTTHKEFLGKLKAKNVEVIELKKDE